jgi:hypothetical protein
LVKSGSDIAAEVVQLNEDGDALVWSTPTPIVHSACQRSRQAADLREGHLVPRRNNRGTVPVCAQL